MRELDDKFAFSTATYVSEKITQKVTDHRTIEALHTCEQVSTDQQKAVSKVLMATVSLENGELSI